MHSITDEQTDRRQYHANRWAYWRQYDWLNTEVLLTEHIKWATGIPQCIMVDGPTRQAQWMPFHCSSNCSILCVACRQINICQIFNQIKIKKDGKHLHEIYIGNTCITILPPEFSDIIEIRVGNSIERVLVVDHTSNPVIAQQRSCVSIGKQPGKRPSRVILEVWLRQAAVGQLTKKHQRWSGNRSERHHLKSKMVKLVMLWESNIISEILTQNHIQPVLLSLALRCPRGQILSPWPWPWRSSPWSWPWGLSPWPWAKVLGLGQTGPFALQDLWLWFVRLIILLQC